MTCRFLWSLHDMRSLHFKCKIECLGSYSSATYPCLKKFVGKGIKQPCWPSRGCTHVKLRHPPHRGNEACKEGNKSWLWSKRDTSSKVQKRSITGSNKKDQWYIKIFWKGTSVIVSPRFGHTDESNHIYGNQTHRICVGGISRWNTNNDADTTSTKCLQGGNQINA